MEDSNDDYGNFYHLACKYHHIEIVKHVIEHIYQHENGLVLAFANDNLDIVKFILRYDNTVSKDKAVRCGCKKW